jgi:hypothetical protein
MSQLRRLTLSPTPACVAARALLSTALAVLIAACADPAAPTDPSAARLSLGKAPSGPSVSAASPAYARRDTTLDVRILGSGFTAGAVAAWELAGVPNPAKVRTNSTQYVSSTELVANITISADADLAFWDVAVTLLGGKKGVGTERFEVTTATILGAGTIAGDMQVQSVSYQGSVTGYAQQGGVFVWDSYTSSLLALGDGQAWGIDPSGTTVLGRDADFYPMEWVRGIAGDWTRRPIPNNGQRGIATRAATAPDGSLVATGWITVPTVRRQTVDQPVLWRRIDGAWMPPVVYAHPGSAAGGYDVSANGRMAGRAWYADGSARGVIWDSPTSYTVLDGMAYGMNDAGTVVVGDRSGVPVYWYRDATTGAWTSTGTPLPAGACAGRGREVIDLGMVTGGSCGQATVWQLDLSGPAPVLVGGPTRLGGLGVKPPSVETSSAAGITSSPPYTVFGGVLATKRLLVSWALP